MTNYEKQAVINNYVEGLYDKFFDEFIPYAETTKCKRLGSCTAFVYKDEKGYIALCSFKTFVAFITPDGEFVDVLRLIHHYTATSAQHIAKFRNAYAGNCSNFYRWRTNW